MTNILIDVAILSGIIFAGYVWGCMFLAYRRHAKDKTAQAWIEAYKEVSRNDKT